MIFYIQPPSGRVHFETLQGCGEKRLLFLLAIGESEGHLPAVRELIQNESMLRNTDCLVEGSMRDIASHFVLRFAFCRRPQALDVFVRAETTFFRYRIETLHPEERRKVLEYAAHEANHTASCLTSKEYREALSNLGRILSTVLKRWDEILHGEYFSLSVPFEHVLSLVDQRLVALKKGHAIVSTSSLSDLLTSLFETVLRHGILHFYQSSTYCAMAKDGRLARMQAYLENLFYGRTRASVLPSKAGERTSLRADEIDEAAKLFPPCMAAHHRLLRTTHRLPHKMRIQYTLFLKEIGLSLDEALRFWSQEYTLDGGGASSCSHAWNKDGRRFIYSIRHLYGYEGSRKDYSAHSCRHLQENGSCPLASCNKADLAETFCQHHLQEIDVEDVWKLCVDGRHLAACAFYQTKRTESHLHKLTIRVDNNRSNVKDELSTDCDADVTHLGRDCRNAAHRVEVSSIKFRKPSGYYLSFKDVVDRSMRGPHKSLEGT